MFERCCVHLHCLSIAFSVSFLSLFFAVVLLSVMILLLLLIIYSAVSFFLRFFFFFFFFCGVGRGVAGGGLMFCFGLVCLFVCLLLLLLLLFWGGYDVYGYVRAIIIIIIINIQGCSTWNCAVWAKNRLICTHAPSTEF